MQYIKTLKAKYLLVVFAACSLQFSIRDSPSCSVPVFRYALERWKPDVYKGIYIYQGKITKEDQALLQQLENAALNSETTLNLIIRPVDANVFSKEKLKDLLKSPVPEKLPALAIWYPEQMGKTAPQWTVEFTAANVKALAGSPKRKELAENLIGGASVVWVFVPSGNPEKDSRAKTLIQGELDFALKSLVKMSFFTNAGAKDKRLTYAFPILTLPRSDPQERFFLDMLMKIEPDLYEYKNEPMVFPVFGRGRALGCLFGDYISKDKVQDAVSFLAASCSCEVKSMNPGIDLLLPAQWDRVLMGALYADDDESLPDLTGVMPGKPAPAQTEAPANQSTSRRKSILAFSGIALSSALLVVIFAGVILNFRRKKS